LIVIRFRRLSLATALGEAIRIGQIEVHYQPSSACVNGALRAVEALARWQHQNTE
jgi:sensor c-di-GMP phosphodiesterase-like protein